MRVALALLALAVGCASPPATDTGWCWRFVGTGPVGDTSRGYLCTLAQDGCMDCCIPQGDALECPRIDDLGWGVGCPTPYDPHVD